MSAWKRAGLQLIGALSRDGAARHEARRGDEVEAWLKRKRDLHDGGSALQWLAVDALLDDYRLHADTGTPLSDDVRERELP